MLTSGTKCVVTGGAGFIGSHVVDALLELGAEVHVVDNLSGGERGNVADAAIFHEVDILDRAALDKICAGARYVFHLAALPRVQYSIEHPAETHEVNVTGTLNVLLAARDAGVRRVVYSASSSAYGDQEVFPLSETMPAKPLSPYGLQKYIGEQYARVMSGVYGLETVSLRYFNVYGPRINLDGAYALVIGAFLRQVKEGRPMTITGDGTQTRDFTHVRDVVRANILAATAETVGKGEVINIGAGRNQSVNRIAELIGGEVEYIAPRLEPHDTLADITRARELLGWHPEVLIEDGLDELKREYLGYSA